MREGMKESNNVVGTMRIPIDGHSYRIWESERERWVGREIEIESEIERERGGERRGAGVSGKA